MEISNEDFLMFIDRALDGMLRIVEELGEERANRCPDLPGANSPYAILTHCIGVCDYGIEIGRACVGKECRSRWSPYH